MAIVVSGATSVLGAPLIKALQTDGQQVVSISRQTADESSLQWDLQASDLQWQQQWRQRIPDDQPVTFLHCAPIWLLPNHIERLAQNGVNRLVAFSSTSIEGKAKSSSNREQQLVDLLRESEQRVSQSCMDTGIALTLLRPTMIYGYGSGQNLAFISKLVHRYKRFVVAGNAGGLRQPVHVDDLVSAVCACMDNPQTYGKTYNLSGSETMTYRQMVERVFLALGLPPKITSIPMPVYRLGLGILRLGVRVIGKSLPIDPAMADRMLQDLVFDHAQASADFAYAPGPFLPNGRADVLSGDVPINSNGEQ